MCFPPRTPDQSSLKSLIQIFVLRPQLARFEVDNVTATLSEVSQQTVDTPVIGGGYSGLYFMDSAGWDFSGKPGNQVHRNSLDVTRNLCWNPSI